MPKWNRVSYQPMSRMEIVSLEMLSRMFSLHALLIFSLVSTDVRPACADAVETADDVLQFGIPAIALGMTGYRRDLPGAGYLTASALVTEAWVWTLKLTVMEERPSGGGQGFPSNHRAIGSGAFLLED